MKETNQCKLIFSNVFHSLSHFICRLLTFTNSLRFTTTWTLYDLLASLFIIYFRFLFLFQLLLPLAMQWIIGKYNQNGYKTSARKVTKLKKKKIIKFLWNGEKEIKRKTIFCGWQFRVSIRKITESKRECLTVPEAISYCANEFIAMMW